MSPASIEILGLLAGTLTTISFAPQVWQVWKSKSAKDISLGMYSLFVLGVAMWLGYGLLVGSAPVYLANTITLILAGAVLVMKVIFDRRDRQKPPQDQQ
ncbi:SemiSWEET transporter [Chitinibacter bivalviorum]|uniref:SemiSWEET transporter n=1 Tax=Chitinibacter bivalviorum TaxID=2739434 RepID=A0A7H9BFC4_9NEIS|nr:SemiSWEET transporter [Chitinibacter bivalviorum]QLG87319.1 SemiSWEET transporter [Chitinibacter bivalviorum]